MYITIVCLILEIVLLIILIAVDVNISNKIENVPKIKMVESFLSIKPVTEKTNEFIYDEPVEVLEEEKSKYISLGTFQLTAYCPCKYCSGGYGKNTSCGTMAEEGRTIAVDPKVIPYGSIIQINGKDYIAEDCGGAVKGKIIDIYFEDHQVASDFGRQTAEIFIKK